MSDSHLQYILSIAKTGSVTAAARACGVSQPTLSRYLDRLEQEIGAELFVRSHRRFTLTPAGEIYVQAAEQIQRISRQTLNSISSTTGKHPKKIRFGATPFMGSTMVAAAFKGFFTLFPDTQIEITEGNVAESIQRIQDGLIDIGLIGIPYSGYQIPDVRYLSMHRSEILAEVPLYHPAARRIMQEPESPHSIDFSELLNTPLVLPGKGLVARQSLDIAFRQMGLIPVIAYETPNINLLHQLAQDGLGISFLPAHNVRSRRTDKTVFLHMHPRTYIYNGFGFHSSHVLTDAEKLLLALIIRNPPILSDVNADYNDLTKSSLKEAEEKGLWTQESTNTL